MMENDLDQHVKDIISRIKNYKNYDWKCDRNIDFEHYQRFFNELVPGLIYSAEKMLEERAEPPPPDNVVNLPLKDKN